MMWSKRSCPINDVAALTLGCDERDEQDLELQESSDIRDEDCRRVDGSDDDCDIIHLVKCNHSIHLHCFLSVRQRFEFCFEKKSFSCRPEMILINCSKELQVYFIEIQWNIKT